MNTSPKQKLAALVWAAFQASVPMGMGFLHSSAAARQTKDTILDQLSVTESPDGTVSVRTDYVCGRMMKTHFAVNADGVATVSPEEPHLDYQSWGRTYRSGSALIAHAATAAN
jgi:hypothetical protein